MVDSRYGVWCVCVGGRCGATVIKGKILGNNVNTPEYICMENTRLILVAVVEGLKFYSGFIVFTRTLHTHLCKVHL